MSGICPNEVEERRVMRLLADAAADVAPLPQGDVDELLLTATAGGAPAGRRRRRVAHHLQHVVAVGAAAAVFISSGLALTSSQPHQAASRTSAADAALTSFPEGSALRLLLSVRGNGGRS